ncbi:MAG: hypothetical protein JXB49_10610 [Bacteroidales bacterium]|nr:hypothetical protein [Bacteroidales bacterium]
MKDIFQSFSEVIIAIAFALVYIVSSILLRPFRIHQKRKVSTISLKTSFLMYLFFLLIYAYMLLFHSKERIQDEEIVRGLFEKVQLLGGIFVFIYPNVAIMIRRSFRKNRVNFNWVNTIINFSCVFYIIFMMKVTIWEF